ncbi:PrpF protein [Fusarium solani]|uniref:PrpF protein n=1 Tax=Fusarium solani TaxID=169388 RepID=A0A9P9H9F0_FUSSL|nr:PrpF protein [Fusarium solani]KAH7252980.1 PrpF protein [Fusarium solani]
MFSRSTSHALRRVISPRALSRPTSPCFRRTTHTELRRQNSLPAAYYRGGTSRAIMLQAKDLPQNRESWGPIFLGCIGSPDPYGRQLDGLGGGVSSLSKVCVVGKSEKPDADVDYTFVSLGIKNTDVDYSSNCGNMSAAVGPYSIDSGLVSPTVDKDMKTTVRVHNTNTGKIIQQVFQVVDGEAAANGDFAIDGVAGTGARVELKFLDPAGSRTGKLFPTGAKSEMIDGARVTCVDAGNPCCFVPAAELGVNGALSPQDIDADKALLRRLEEMRRKAGVKMGLAETEDSVPGSVPKIGIVSKPMDSQPNAVVVRAMSVGQPHKAIPVTVALAVAAAGNIPGTTVDECLAGSLSSSEMTIRHASGTLDVAADISHEGQLESATVFRTARRLMEGRVFWK